MESQKPAQELEISRIQEIVELHNEVGGHLRVSLQKAMRIGELLEEQKRSMKHGEFARWLERNIPFTPRTAQNYMRLHRSREYLKNETVSDLKEAYRLLAPPKQDTRADAVPESIFDLPAEHLLYAIEAINEIIGAPEHMIDRECFRIADDESMSEEEKRVYEAGFNITIHFCYWRRFAWQKGLGALPEGIRKYLTEVEKDKPGMFTAEPKPLCDECKAEFD